MCSVCDVRVCRTTSTTVWRSSESVTAFVVVSHVYTTPPLYARLLVLTSASCIIRSSVSRENSPHSPAPVTHTLKNVTRNSFRGVFSHVPFLSFLSPIFLPIPSLSPASNLPFNPATSVSRKNVICSHQTRCLGSKYTKNVFVAKPCKVKAKSQGN